jgi:hypothetical protein
VNGDRIVAALRRPAMLVLLWIAALWKFVSALLTLPPLAHRLDFVCFYDSALALRLGLNPYTTNLAAVGNRFGLETGPLIHAVDTPVFLLLIEPLTLFTPATTFWIWTSFNLVVLAFGIYLLLIRRPGLDANAAWLLGALILAFYPVGWNFFWAQKQVLILVLLVSAMRAMEDGHDDGAGLLVAVAGLLRAYPFLLLGYFALRRNWRALKFAIAGAIVGALFPVLLLGFARCFSFVHGPAWMSNHDGLIFPFNISVSPFVSRMYWALLGPTAADWARRALVFAVDAIFLGMTVRVTLASVGRRDDDFRIYSLWIVTTILLSPIAWHHYLVLLVLPFVQMAIAVLNDRARPRELWMAAASYLLACVSVPITFQLLAHPTAFQRAFPSLSVPLLETGFFTLLMAYVAVYWFVADLKSDDRAVESPDLTDQAPSPLKAIGA